MRVFWILMGVLVFVAAGVVLAKRSGGDDAPVRDVAIAASAPVDTWSAAPATSDADVDRVVRSLSAQRDDQPSDEIGDGGPAPVEQAGDALDLDALLGTEEARDEEARDMEAANASETPEALAITTEAPADDVVVIGDEPTDAGEDNEVAEAVAAEPVAAEAVAPDAAPIVEQDDGSLLVKGAYVVRGEGTEQSPYEMGLDMLVSVQEEYNPRAGQDEIPGWLSRFQGKHVRIVGHLLFPLWADETNEVLLMKNQWDGCCIGVPPTPYDAIEVKLAQAVDLTRVASDYGTIEGRFEIDPYIRSNWLLGLYVIDGAQLQR